MHMNATCYTKFVYFFLSIFLCATEHIQILQPFNAYFTKEQKRFWIWAKQAGGSGRSYGSSAAVDEQGNAYVTGFLSSTVGFLGFSSGTSNFDGRILTPRSEMDMIVVKYQPNGSILWIKQIGDTGGSNAESIAIGKDGNIYITGTIRRGIIDSVAGRALIDSFELSSTGDSDMFIMVIDPSGEVVRAIQSGSSGEVRGEGIAVDSAGNCYVTGIFKGRFGNTKVLSAGNEDIFIAKYDNRGHQQWVQGIGGPAQDESTDIAVDQDGNCYVTGSLEKEVNHDTLKTSPERFWNFFLAKYDSKGTLLWLHHGLGNTSYSKSIGYSVAVDAKRNSYVTGGFTSELILGATKLNSTPTNDPEAPEFEVYDEVFVVKYNPDGKPVWAIQGGGPSGDFGEALTLDAAANIYVTGTFIGNAIFGTTKLTGSNNGSKDRQVFVAKYDSNGILQWVEQSTKPRRLSGWPQSSGTGIAINARGDCYVTGFFDIAIQFGSIKLEGFNSRNMFVAKINSR